MRGRNVSKGDCEQFETDMKDNLLWKTRYLLYISVLCSF